MNISRSLILITFSIITLTLVESCSSSNDDGLIEEYKLNPVEVITSQGISIPVYDFIGFKPMLDNFNDTVYVINFWATWCKPCVQELPYFNKADSAFSDKPVRIVLVSLDFTENVESTLIPFLINNNIQAEVVVLDDMDSNSWISRVDPEWEGAIPATLFYKKRDRHFEVRSYSFEELNDQIINFLNR